jgi:hypothetical protein
MQKYSHTQKKTSNPEHDPCKICGKNLYYNDIVTQRVGMIESCGDIKSWKCPFCESEFDLDDNILYIYGAENVKGLA